MYTMHIPLSLAVIAVIVYNTASYISVFQYSIAVTAPILKILIHTPQIFVKNSCTEFHENPRNSVVADIESRKDRQTCFAT